MNTIKSKIGKHMGGLTLTLGAMVFSLGLSAQSGQILHSPEYIETTVGETFEVTVNIDAAGDPVSVIDVHMRFNPWELEVVSIESLVNNMGGMMIDPTFNNTDGTISIGAFEIGNNLPTGQFPMMNITFMALSPTASAYVGHPLNQFPRSIFAYAGENMLSSVGPLDIQILPAVVSSVDDITAGDVSTLAVWPNPASDDAFVRFELVNSGAVSVDLLDASGKIVADVYRGSAAAGAPYRFDLDVSQLSTGMYLCRMITNEGVLVERVVVRR
ncbi:MAG: T9SS C-terminal target domain-containing protein [Cryomorphaceae bacterium]|nr:MAG: T9SS C-terminal target domain-containing protein [Cryomorphaceae bacterium]